MQWSDESDNGLAVSAESRISSVVSGLAVSGALLMVRGGSVVSVMSCIKVELLSCRNEGMN